MKTPDKIFLPGYIDWTSAALLTLGNQPNDIEYIRKDVLLEWVKKEMKEWSSESTTAQGVKMGLTLVIDKIELL